MAQSGHYNGSDRHIRMRPVWLAVSNRTPQGERRARDLVTLRCVAGTLFKKATGLDCAPDLTEQQRAFGALRPKERMALLAPVGKY